MHDAMNAYNYNFLVTVPDWAEDYAPNGRRPGLASIPCPRKRLTKLQVLSSSKAIS